MFTGAAKVCGIIGNPLEHSLSPLLHRILARECGLDFAYLPFVVQKENLKRALQGAYALGIEGLNITLPYKKAVMPYLEELDEEAARTGSVNTLLRTKNSYKGFNTDMPGLKRAIEDTGMCVSGRDIILLGAGGAASALLQLCAKEKARHICIVNRSTKKAEMLAEEYGNRLEISVIGIESIENAGRKEDIKRMSGTESPLVFQASSLGMYPDTKSCLIHNPVFYEYAEWGLDFIYTPIETMFMRRLKECKKEAYNGLGMLIYQGILSFELWNRGIKIDKKTEAVAKKELQEVLLSNQRQNMD